TRERKRVQQLEVYNDLDVELGRPPLKSEWIEACGVRGIPARIGQGPEGHEPTFKTFSELQDAAAMVNHRVVDVVNAGRADVYNMTVEQNHNLALVTEVESRKTPGKMNLSGVFTAQCGEIALEEFENCNLGHVNLDAFYDDFEGAIEAHRLMSRFLIRATFGDVPDPKQRAVLDRNRRVGVGHFGFQGWLAKQGIRYSDSHRDPYVRKTLKDFYNAVRKESRRYAFQLRIPEPIKVTTVAPTGTIAKLAGRTEGIHPVLFKYYINRVRFSTVDPNQIQQLENYKILGYDIEDDLYSSNTKIVSFVAKNSLLDEVSALGYDPDYVVEAANEISLADMLAVQAMYQESYADNAVSFTVNVNPHPNQTKSVQKQFEDGVHVFAIEMPSPPKEAIQKTMDTIIHYLPQLKGTTLMVDGSRPQSPYEALTQEQYEEILARSEEHLMLVGDGIDENCLVGGCPIK
ncbi:MAG: hypothetical protein LC687_06875, partial [Actinobacteria bacterium]|nr:hypothetical protein [Actinomycetota bacterium]